MLEVLLALELIAEKNSTKLVEEIGIEHESLMVIVRESALITDKEGIQLAEVMAVA